MLRLHILKAIKPSTIQTTKPTTVRTTSLVASTTTLTTIMVAMFLKPMRLLKSPPKTLPNAQAAVYTLMYDAVIRARWSSSFYSPRHM